MRFVIGVDEAGRGALAGPVAVGAVLVPAGFDWALVPGVADSKALTPLKRERVFANARALMREGALAYAVAMTSAGVIDRRGITYAVRMALARAVVRLEADPRHTFVKLDGLLRAPADFVHQETIIRGDATEPEISLASIMAKVTRDRLMVRLAGRLPDYGFEVHKGYGTRTHRAALLSYGPSVMHRRTFCHL